MSIYEIAILRKLVLPTLKRFAFDFRIRHPWVENTKVYLNSFKHKGYWYHRARREKTSMELFSQLIAKGDAVVEVGGHIGFISAYFAKLVGAEGKVCVFEPGSNNLPYIRRNLTSEIDSKLTGRIKLFEKAVGERTGIVEFFEDSLTGQNNSVVPNFEGLTNNKRRSYVKTEVLTRTVQLVSLDDFLPTDQLVDFIKIDIEGYEWFALKGAAELIKKSQPKIMVETQANRDQIFDFFCEHNYLLFDANKQILNLPRKLNGNVFCLHKVKHLELLKRLEIREPRLEF